jgi:hypothetical protein
VIDWLVQHASSAWLFGYVVGFGTGCAFVYVAQFLALRFVVRRLQRQHQQGTID